MSDFNNTRDEVMIPRSPQTKEWKEDEILSRAISHYGEPAQVLKCIEELAELAYELSSHLSSDEDEDVMRLNCIENALEYIKEQSKEFSPSCLSFDIAHVHDVNNDKRVASELADVSITTAQMLKIFNCSDEVERIKQEKLSRLEERMGGDSQ